MNNVLTLCFRHAPVPGRAYPGVSMAYEAELGIELLLLFKDTDRGGIGGPIIDDQHLQLRVGLSRQRSQGVRQVSSQVVERDADSGERVVAHEGVSGRRSLRWRLQHLRVTLHHLAIIC